MTADDLCDRLAAKYAPPVWAFLPQVRNSTGFVRAPRTMDALAMGLWPSRGLEVEGFEVKVDRGDWLRELRAPEKADDLWAYCDRWWLVVSELTIVQPGELPGTWGLMVPHAGGLKVAVVAPKQATDQHLDRLFVAAILRRTVEVVTPAARLRAQYEAGKKDGLAAARKDDHYNFRSLRETVAKFEAASGVSLKDNWRAGDIGEAVKAVLNRPQAIQELQGLKRSAERIIAECDRALAEEVAR